VFDIIDLTNFYAALEPQLSALHFHFRGFCREIEFNCLSVGKARDH